MQKEASARIKINRLLEQARWRFFDEAAGPANIVLEPNVRLTRDRLDALGDDLEKAANGFVDFLLLDGRGTPLIVLEAKSEDKNPLSVKEQARIYARSQNARFVILSNGNIHYLWDLEQGNPTVVSTLLRVGWGDLSELEIPLPPLEVQREIVAEIEGYQRVINGARAVLDNYRPQIVVDPAWPLTTLGNAAETIMTGPFGTSLKESDYAPEGVPAVNPKNIVAGRIETDGIKRVGTETIQRLTEFTLSPAMLFLGGAEKWGVAPSLA